MSQAKQQALEFIQEAQKHGFSIEATNSVVRISKSFAPGDTEAFTYCDMFAYSVLSKAPLKGGSIWGTDGASVGGAIGLRDGHFILNKSGSGSRFMNALKKEIGQ
jgi:hypothetical protein